jgi:hypothetical protein
VRSWAARRDGGSGHRLIKRIVAFGRLFIPVQRGSSRSGYGEEGALARRLEWEMPNYDEARIVRLLRLLRAAPVEWVRRAQRIPLKSAPLSEQELVKLTARLERDPVFRRAFDSDPIAAVRSAGMSDLGSRLEYEIGELIALAEHVARDAERREELVGALAAEGVSAESLYELMYVSDFEPHMLQPRSLEQQALLLALSSTAVADELRASLGC